MPTIQMYPDLLDYCNAKIKRAGDSKSMISFFCEAVLRADPENFAILFPALEHFARTMPALEKDLERERLDRA